MVSEHIENLIVITGGARSGKSLFAEELARDSTLPVTYVATMPNLDDDAELAYKVEQHRRRRPAQWRTVEAQLAIHDNLKVLQQGPAVCVIDCLSLYISNIMLDLLKPAAEHSAPPAEQSDFSAVQSVSPALLADLDKRCVDSVAALIDVIRQRNDLQFIVVTNEVGWSVVPDNKMARVYKDLLGNANQSIAKAAGTVYLACVGLRIKLKENGIGKLE